MKVNHKQMYLMLKQQAKALQNQLTPAATAEQVNEIPENFNQIGWDLTVEKLELLIAKMKKLQEVAKKKNRLTPQFYRSIYNRALIGASEADKQIESLETDIDNDIDFEAECVKLNAEIYTLNIQVAEKVAADKAAEEAAQKAAEEAEAARQAEEAKQAEEAAKAESGKGAQSGKGGKQSA